jgi:PAS domain S-box-containing protein
MKNHLAANLCERIIAQMPEAVIVADRDGRIRLWNRGAEAMFGHSSADVAGKSLDIIIPEHLRQRHWEGYHRAMAAGRTQSGDRALPTKAVRKDGATIYVELSFAIALDDTGAAIGALAVGRNITERYLHDRSLRQRLAALEQEAATRAPLAGSADTVA